MEAVLSQTLTAIKKVWCNYNCRIAQVDQQKHMARNHPQWGSILCYSGAAPFTGASWPQQDVKPAPRWASEPPSPWWGVYKHLPPYRTRLLCGIAKKRESRWIAHTNSWRNYIGHFLAQINIEVMAGQRRGHVREEFRGSSVWRSWVRILLRDHSLPIITANWMMYTFTILGQNTKMTWPEVRPKSLSGLA